MGRVIIDNRMREFEQKKLKELGYECIKLKKSSNVYEEISSHVDIFITKLRDKIIIAKEQYDNLKIENSICGQVALEAKYPKDVSYNVCNIGNFVIHCFDYTDPVVLKWIEKLQLQKISIQQGYSNCSIAVIDENSCIVTDKIVAGTLRKYGIDVLLIEEKLDIKLWKGNEFSSMNGFIGGTMTRLGDAIFITGDLRKIDPNHKIEEYILSRKLKIIDFKGYDVIDYGGIIEV